MIAAAYWQALDDRRVACLLCPVGCTLRPGQDGPCGTRGNRDGAMVALQYGKVVAAGLDPMEKKPLFHFLPGRPILSVAAMGCNLHCAFCQNWQLSQTRDGRAQDLSPQAVVRLAQQQRSTGIAYTYSEPLVWFEFVRDTARLARAAGLVNVVVSNGYLNPQPLAELLPLLDAANIDLKSSDDRFYREVCQGRLAPVLATLAAIYTAGVHLEVTHLVIPGYNDSDEQLARLRDLVADVSPEIPLHLSAYHPDYRFDAPATPPDTLLRAARICAETLRYVYVGNVALDDWQDTRCPSCGEVVIERDGYRTVCRLTTPACPACGRAVPIVLG
ncbi:MAG: AmmeMemoRadiSam system radical SAM enzyme [Candidatus Krumholzibacteria bacterium]|nr:AmmeMemoRadiSam system radical SAM enzyme [Candidatus Krumholzibacteria bacterium]